MRKFKEQFNKLVKVTLSERQKVNDQTDEKKNTQVMDESTKSKDFLQDNNTTLEKRYTTTRIKSRNFLFNIAYVRINKEDLCNENSIFDVYLLVTKNLNPFSLLTGQKIGGQKQARNGLHALERVHAHEILQGYLQGKKLFNSKKVFNSTVKMCFNQKCSK